MITGDPIVASAGCVDAAKTFLRLEHDDDDAAVAALVVAAIAQCESFTRATVLRRAFAQTMTLPRAWQVLGRFDVTAILGVTAPDGMALPGGSVETDIDDDGYGRVRATAGAALKVRVRFEAGLAEDWDEIIEPLRLGILRLVAYNHAQRDRAADPGPPGSVSALWQPSRRMRLQ